MIKATGLLDQLHMAQADSKSVHFGGNDIEDEGEGRNRAGGNGENKNNVSPIPNTVEVFRSATDDEEGEEETDGRESRPPSTNPQPTAGLMDSGLTQSHVSAMRPRSNVSSATSEEEYRGNETTLQGCTIVTEVTMDNPADGRSQRSRIQPTICQHGASTTSNQGNGSRSSPILNKFGMPVLPEADEENSWETDEEAEARGQENGVTNTHGLGESPKQKVDEGIRTSKEEMESPEREDEENWDIGYQPTPRNLYKKGEKEWYKGEKKEGVENEMSFTTDDFETENLKWKRKSKSHCSQMTKIPLKAQWK